MITQSLSVGAKIWGCIAEIHPKELIVSLPHGLRGRVQYSEVHLFMLMPVGGAGEVLVLVLLSQRHGQLIYRHRYTTMPVLNFPRRQVQERSLAQKTC